MSKELTLKDLKAAIELLNKNQAKPLVIETEEEAKAANRQSRMLAKIFGLPPHKWEVGDEYYLLRANL